MVLFRLERRKSDRIFVKEVDKKGTIRYFVYRYKNSIL